MPRGQPDFGLYAEKELIGSASDLGEAAARLGSIVTYDRRGDVLFLECFENDISGWFIETDGLGASVDVSAEHKLRGMFSMKLVAGRDDERYAKATVRISPIPSTRIGMEIAVTLDTNMETWEAWNNYYTGSHRITAAFKFDRLLNKWYALTTGDTWLEIPIPVAPYFSPYLFYFSKSVFDIALLTYIRQVTANISFDLSAIPLSVETDFTAPHLEAYVKLIAQAGFNPVVYLDSCIVTFNEP